MTRVLFIDQTAQLGGAELCLLDILRCRSIASDRVVLFQDGPFVERLRELGLPVTVRPLGRDSAGIRKDSGLLAKLSSSWSVGRLVARLVSDARSADIVYANTPKAVVIGGVAAKLAGKPFIYHLHDILSSDHFSRSNLRLLIGIANRCAAAVIANSTATAEAFSAAGGRLKPVVIANGFDPEPFEQAFTERATLRSTILQSLRLPPGVKLAAVFGRLAPWKGQHVALQALATVPNTHLLIVGAALFGEDAYAESLQRLARELVVADRVHFLGFCDDVKPLMQASDVVVHCSTVAEPFGRVIVETMLSRRPIIASDAGGAQEIVEHGKTGWLCPPGDAQQLGSAMRRVLEKPQDAEVVALQGYTTARATYGLQAVVQQINALISSTSRLA